MEIAWAIQREDGSWLLDGLMPVSELKARLALDELPSEDRGRYNTLAGLLLFALGRLPKTGEKVDIGNYEVTTTRADSRRVLQLHFRRRGTDEAAGAPEAD